MLEEQEAITSRWAFAQLCVVCMFLNQLVLLTSHLHCGHYVPTYMGPTLKSIQKLQLAQNAVAQIVLPKPKFIHVSPPLQALYRLPLCFWVHFKLLVILFKAVHVLGPGYLKGSLSPVTSTQPTRMQDILWVPSIKEILLWDQEEEASLEALYL